MKLKAKDSNFEPCPEYTGAAVCVDVTPLKKKASQYGEQEVFKIVFEINVDRGDGSRFCAWSRNFTATIGEKANLRKFLRLWFGRDLTAEELTEFDTESLIGRPASLVVVHEHKDGEVYANIAACMPHKNGEPLRPCGRYVRVKDRQAEPAPTSYRAGGTAGAAPSGGYRRAQQLESDSGDLGATKIHVGRCKGLEVRDLAPEQVQALIANWLPAAKANAKPTADDRRLIAALEWWESTQAVAADNIPY